MIGYGENRGIVPLSCEEIFNRIENAPNKELAYEVTVSMIEIYKEKVFDLLSVKRNHLTLREYPDRGFQAENVMKKPC